MPTRQAERIIFQTKYFTIKDVDLQFADGHESTYQILEKGDSALVVPITKEGNIVFIREYFAAIDAYALALPKGRIDLGEGMEEAAQRELQEEIGYKANKLTYLQTLTMSPCYFTQKTHVFLAEGLDVSKLQGDEEEAIEIVEYPFNQFEELIEKGELTEARMIAALFLARGVLVK